MQWSRHLVSPLASNSTQTPQLVKYVGGTYLLSTTKRVSEVGDHQTSIGTSRRDLFEQ